MSAQSQQGPNQQQPQQQQPATQASSPNTSSQQGSTNVIVNVQAPSETDEAKRGASQSTEKDNDDEQDGGNWWSVISAGAALAQAIFAGVLLFLTGALIWVGWKQRDTSDKQGQILNATLIANKIIERGYIDLSHHPPGLIIPTLATADRMYPQPGASRAVEVRIGITNRGNTPATVTRTLIQFLFTNQPLPDKPPYDESKAGITDISLVRDAAFTLSAAFDIENVTIEKLSSDPTLKLYVIGYVLYRDRFGSLHRAGYARAYNPAADDRRNYTDEQGRFNETAWSGRNNLPYVTKPGYNYDEDVKES